MDRVLWIALIQILFFGHSFCLGQVFISTQRVAPIGIINYASDVETFSGNFHIDGYVRKHGDNHFVFPVGQKGVYRPFAASADGTQGAYYNLDPNNSNSSISLAGGPFITSRRATLIATISDREFWDIDGTNLTKISLTWNENSKIVQLLKGENLNSLKIAGWNGDQWEEIPCEIDLISILGIASNLTNGSLTTISPIKPDDYQAYTLATHQSSALPVTLLNFTVQNESLISLIKWETISEVNASHFEIEHSLDGTVWSNIGSVQALFSNPDDKITASRQAYQFKHQASSGQNLYRLKMVDADYSFSYSQIRSLLFENQQNQLYVFPNPASDRLYITEPEKIPYKRIMIFYSTGTKILELASAPKEGIPLTNFQSGVYMVKLESLDGSVITSKIIIKK